MSIESMKLPPSEREAFEAFAQNCPMGKYSIARRGDGYDSSHTQLMWDAWQARAQVQGEPFGYIHHFAAHDERGALIDTTWEADGCADPLPHPTFPVMWKWSHCMPFYTTPQPAQVQGEVCPTCGETEPYTGSCGTSNNDTKALCKQPPQATQATPSIPSDGPSTYAQRFTAAVAVICGVTPPAALVCDWINKEERHDDLQQWVGSYAPGWVQNIAVLDAAHQMADQPTEGGNHEPAQQPVAAIACGIPGMAKTTCPYCEQGFTFEHEQPVTTEPVQADSSEHLRVVASLGDALRRLSFAAQTTGGTDGPDAELQSAIGQAEQALSLGGIWQAMSATTEPVKAAPYNTTEEMRCAMKRIDPALSSEQCRALWSAAWSAAPSTHPAPSVLKDDQIAALVNKVRDIARMFNDHQSLRERIAIELVPALKVSQEVKSDAERGRFLIEWLKRYGLLHAEFGQMGVGKKPENWWLLYAPWGIDQTRPFLGHGKTPEQAIDDAKEEPNV